MRLSRTDLRTGYFLGNVHIHSKRLLPHIARGSYTASPGESRRTRHSLSDSSGTLSGVSTQRFAEIAKHRGMGRRYCTCVRHRCTCGKSSSRGYERNARR
jgi:hypothetical protein